MRRQARAASNMLIALTEAQVLVVIKGATPLLYQDREPFYVVVADLLEHEEEIGDGTVFRVVKVAQAQFERPQPAEHRTRWE